ncbi:hypothetical protein MRB53_002574 [Persea americana]|uniref:Uncharacterized protein n=1 Tax=Persea americana TaxID=3435 RepID=A0ACC2MVT8_PERAE|nr:hypothetical protein MRB53_002574 [Persea americana]
MPSRAFMDSNSSLPSIRNPTNPTSKMIDMEPKPQLNRLARGAVLLGCAPRRNLSRRVAEKVNPAVYKIGRSQASKNKWVEMGKTLVELSRKVEHVAGRAEDLLQRVHDGKVIDTKDIEDLKKRKLITLQTWKGYSLQKGPNYAPKRVKAAADLTRDHLLRTMPRQAIKK